MANDAWLSIGEAASKIRKRYGAGPAYSSIWAQANDGRIPAERVGGKLVIRESTLPTIAAHFKLTEPAAA